MSKDACALCGKDPAAGWAKVGDHRYCHGDYDPDPTCYMRAQRIDLPALRITNPARPSRWRGQK